MKHIAITILSFLCCCQIFAQTQKDTIASATPDSLLPERKIVELGIDEKIIYVNELGLPPNTMVIDALSMFPEILGRNITDLINRFDVQLDDVSVGFNKLGLLAHTMICEVHHIEITTDPSVSQSTSGVGGVIDIISASVEPGVSGQASLDVYSNFNLVPSVTVAYKKDKLTLYSSALLSYYDFKEDKNETKEYKRTDEWYSYQNYFKGLSESFKFGLAYQFNKHDKLTCWVIQNLDNYTDSTSKEQEMVIYPYENRKDSGNYYHGFYNINSPALHSQIDAIIKFERLYDRPSQKLFASLTYSNNYAEDENTYYSRFTSIVPDSYSIKYSKYTNRPHNISSSLYYRFHLLPATIDHILKLKVGMNYNMGFSNGTDYSSVQQNYTFNDYTQDYTLTPYATFNYEWSKLKMELSLKYRFKARRGRGEDADWQDNFYNDFIGNFNITYIPVANHQLRASTSRSMNTPSNLQLYSKRYYKQIDNKWYQGNPNLKEADIINVDLQYFYQYRSRKHEFQLNAAIEYVNAKDLVYQTTFEDFDAKTTVTTWANSDITSHIVDGRLSLFWQTGIFSATFAGNFYDQIQKPTNSDKLNNIFYFNLKLQPVLHFERGWTISGQCIYNSHVYNGDLTQGNAVYMDFNVAKAWGAWAARLTFENTYDFTSTDVEKSGDVTVTTNYKLYNCQIKVGFTYAFYKEPTPKKKLTDVTVL